MIKKKFTQEEYQTLYDCLKVKNYSLNDIVNQMKRSKSTICSIIKRNGGYDNFQIPNFKTTIIKKTQTQPRIPIYVPLEKSKKISEMLQLHVPLLVIARKLDIPEKSLVNFIKLGGGKINFDYKLAYEKRKKRCKSFNIQTDFFSEFPINSDIEEIKTDTPKTIEFEFADEPLPEDLKKLHEASAIPEINTKTLDKQIINETIDIILKQLHYIKYLINGN